MTTRIVLPVYNAAHDLARCLAALARHTEPSQPVTLIDDASTDPEIPALLAEFAATRGGAEVLRNPVNLGFIATVNRGFRRDQDDILILNSDTVPTHGFLRAIEACGRSDARIATVTPFSNNAEICSYPNFVKANPEPEDAEAVARAFAMEESAEIDVPTGVGFCMWISRLALATIGDFDAATFGRGYGEENDFCQRAIGHGFRNVVCSRAYVVHRGHASFAETGERPGGENLKRLVARYPRYNADVAEFIQRDPLAAIRNRVLARLRR